MARNGYIYALCDKAGVPYYVGKTVQSPGVRLGEHRREASRRGRASACHRRTLALLALDQGPAIWVLEGGVKVAMLNRRERYWIAYGEGAGWELENYTGGGNGALVMGSEARERQRRLAACQPRDLYQRFLPLGSPETVKPDGQIAYTLSLGDASLPF